MRLFTRLFATLCLLTFLLNAAHAQNKPVPISKPAVPHITKPASGPRYAWRNVEIGGGGGFVDGILFHPKQPDLIYCRTDIGGVYRWDAKLNRWIPLTDWVGQDNGNLRGGESIAVDPTDPNRVYVAAGTYSRPDKTAILSSTDQGNTWKQSPLPIEMGGNEDGRGMGERLAVDPNHPSTLYFGSRHDGLWKSDDYAATWKKVDSFPAVADNPPPAPGGGFRFAPRRFAGVCWVVFDPSSGGKGQPSQVIYAGVAAPTMPTLWESKDAGASWQPVPGAPASLMPHHAVLDFDGTLYLSYSNGIGPNGVTDGAVWKLDTKTGTWTDISPIKATSDSPGGFGGLALDAKHPGTVMVATLDHWKPADEIYRTTDGGAHWAAISPTASLDPTTAPWLYWGNSQPRFGWWFAALAIDPFHSGRVLYGTGATIWGTDDITPADSGHATDWRMYAEGVEETAVTALISPPAGPHLISGLGDIGGFTHHDLAVSPPEGMSSNPIFTSTSSLDYAELDPSVIVRAGTGTDALTKSGSKHGAYSLDGGNKWTPFATEPAGSRGGGTVVVTADGNTILWAAQGAAVSCTRDHGTTWSVSAGLPQPDPNSPRSYFGQVRLRLVADRVNPSKVYALGGQGNKMYVSTDAGASFTPVAATGLPTGVTSLVAVPGVEGDLWVTAGDNGLYLSTDSGAAFTKVESVKTADGLGLGKSPPGAGWVTLFLIGTPSDAGAVHGIYRSDDSGAHWVRINDDQTQYGWIGLPVVGDPRVYGRVYVGTNGRGIIVADPVK